MRKEVRVKAPPDQAVFEQGKRTVRTKHGTVVFDIPKAVTLQEFSKAFAAMMEGA